MTASSRYLGYTHLVAVGACYIDTILSVPQYPSEDSKQRASSLSKRRGGNCPNTLEVLQQLLPLQNESIDSSLKQQDGSGQLPQLVLISTLPSKSSADTKFIANSFNPKLSTIENSSLFNVNLSHTFHRPQDTAASSYIIQAEATSSRTIVNYNALKEMTFPEFQGAVDSLVATFPTSLPKDTSPRIWFHFEGRIPDVTLQCILWLHSALPDKGVGFSISVECEKPNRPGLHELASEADVVFYSRSWAEGQGYKAASVCLNTELSRILSDHKEDIVDKRGGSFVLCCTWGFHGASVLTCGLMRASTGEIIPESGVIDVIEQPAWHPVSSEKVRVVDTVGAGDTWIAGMLFGFLCQPRWEMKNTLAFANELAGRKVTRHGFGGLGMEMRQRIREMRHF